MEKRHSNERSPHQEPRIPQIGMPSHCVAVRVGWGLDDIGFNQKPARGVHQAIAGEDERLDSGETAYEPPRYQPAGSPALAGRQRSP